MAQTQAALESARGLPPGPRGLKMLRRMFTRDMGELLAGAARDYGDVTYFRFYNVPICVVVQPAAIEEILVKNSGNFVKPRHFRVLKNMIGNGLLVSEGDFWQAQRKRIHPTFRHEKISGYARIMVDSTAAMLAGWKNGETRDIHAEMMSVTLEIVAKSLFGSDVSGDAQVVRDAVAVAMDQFIAQATMAYLLPKKVPVPKGPRLEHSLKKLDEVIYKLIWTRRTMPLNGDDLLQELLQAQDEHGNRMTDEQLRDEVMTLFMAGHETTANALAWTWYLLAQHPEKEQALLAELSSVLGNRAPDMTDLARLTYTDMVIKESMRLYPPAWVISREAIHDFDLDSYRIPAGTNVFALQWVTQRDARFFPEAERFEPERWRDDPARKGKLPRGAYFPFGGGPRVCVGAAFAMMEATLLLATIAQRFRPALPPGAKVKALFSVTLRPKNGLPMVLHQRA